MPTATSRGAAAAAAALALLGASAALAETARVRLGDAEFAYDAARWQMLAQGDDALEVRPTSRERHGPAPVRIARAAVGCLEAARIPFSLGPYHDESEVAPVVVAGIRGERHEAHTGCRNATPRGVAVCLPYRGSAYVISATIPNCRSGLGNLFSDTDPLADILSGVRFLD